MKKVVTRKVSVFLLLAAVFFFAGGADASVITIINSTDFDIEFIYISDSKANDWGDDVLGDEIPLIESEKSNEINAKGSYRQFDLKVIYDDGNDMEWHGFPGNVKQITLYADGTAEYQ